jgi:hypothetical protein
MVSDFKHGDPKMDFKWWICFNTPTSWQPQIGKMRFFSPPGDRWLEMPKALDHLAASLTTN